MKPFFSIITATLNSEKFLRDNIESVKKQTFQDFEHIFIDGFSNDGTFEIIKEYQQEMGESKVKIFQYSPKGITDAFNKGIQHSEGVYLFFLNSDDYFYNETVLEIVYKFLSKNDDYDWIYGKVNVVKNNVSLGIWPRKTIWHQNYKTLIGKWLLNVYNFIPHQAVFIKKDVFENFGYFDLNLRLAQDMEYWLRIKDKTKWTFFDIVVSNYRVEENANSVKNKDEYIKEERIMRRKYLNKFEFFIYKLVKFLASFYRKY